jgi:hypothetical protein
MRQGTRRGIAATAGGVTAGVAFAPTFLDCTVGDDDFSNNTPRILRAVGLGVAVAFVANRLLR